jgi:hypothetical protein
MCARVARRRRINRKVRLQQPSSAARKLEKRRALMEDWAAYLTGGAALIPARDMVRIPARLAQTFLTLQTLRLSQAPCGAVV